MMKQHFLKITILVFLLSVMSGFFGAGYAQWLPCGAGGCLSVAGLIAAPLCNLDPDILTPMFSGGHTLAEIGQPCSCSWDTGCAPNTPCPAPLTQDECGYHHTDHHTREGVYECATYRSKCVRNRWVTAEFHEMDDPNGPVDELCKPIGASLPPAACNANLCCCDCCFLKALVPRPGGGLACSCLGSAYSGIYVFSSLIAGDMVSGTTYTPTQLPFNAGTGCTDIATGSNCTLCGGGCPCAGVQCSARQVQYLPRECIRIRCSVSCPDSDPCP